MAMLKRFCQWMLRRRYPAVPVALGLLLALPSLWGGLEMDDFTIRTAVLESEVADGVRASRWEPFTFLDGDPQRAGRLMDAGLLPWWTDPHCRLAFWRPLTAMTHMLDFLVWPQWPWLMHAQSLAWFGLLIWATAVLYRRLFDEKEAEDRRAHPAWVAALAALLFAVDDAHAFPVGWLANRNALLAGLAVVLALVAHDRWRRDGWRAGAWVAPLALLAGLLAKESAVCGGGYLLAYAIFLDRGPGRTRWLSLLPYVAVAIVWYAVYRSLGFGVSGSGVYVDPASDPTGFVRQAARYGPILLLAQWGFPLSDLSMMWSASALEAHWLWAVVYLTLLALLLWPLVVRDALARFWAMGMLLSVLPACLAFPMDRLLMFVGLGAMGLLAQLFVGWKEGARWVPRLVIWRRAAPLFIGLLAAIHLVLAPVLLVVLVNLPGLMGDDFRSIARGYPSDQQLRRQTLVIVNPISLGTEWLLTQQRRYRQEPVPERRLLLTTACSAASLTRTDAQTLVVRVQGGFLPPLGGWPDCPHPPAISPVYSLRMFDRLVRGDRNPLRLGQVIELSTATVEITELTPDGRAAEVRFRFRVPLLEDPSLRWLESSRRGFTPFDPPAIGTTAEVALVP